MKQPPEIEATRALIRNLLAKLSRQSSAFRLSYRTKEIEDASLLCWAMNATTRRLAEEVNALEFAMKNNTPATHRR